MHKRKNATGTGKVEGEEMGHFSEWQLTMISGDMWAAGMETTVTTLNWALLYLIHYPDFQRGLHTELDEVVGQGEVVMADKPRLPLLCAFIAEVQRLGNIIPINLQHRTLRPVQVAGFTIPADTVLIPQIGAVHADPNIFPEPDAFKPERFLGLG